VLELDGTTFTTGSITAPADMDALVVALNNMTGVSDLGTFSTDAGKDDLIFTSAGSGEYATSTIKSEGFTSNYSSANFTDTSTSADYTAAADDEYTLTVGTRTVVATDTDGAFTDNKDIAAALQAQALDDGITDFEVTTAGDYDNGVITVKYTSSTGSESETTYTLEKTSGTGGSSVTGAETSIDVSSANDAIAKIDAALAAVASERATLGATQSQLESTVRNLANVAENTAAAAGRIMDTDYAAETANLTKAQILQQAATSILAQANAQPQSVLSLLQ
jgi:flagellin